MARKKRGPDNLAMDATRALAAGMSYGKWKAFHPHTKDDTIYIPATKTKPCEICGKPMSKGGRVKRYCSPECSYEAKRMRDKEFREREKERIHG